MSRARNIKPSFFTNDILAECEPLARLLFAGLWTIADRAGRLEDRPKKIKAEILPYDDCDPENLLQQLTKYGFILRYISGNNRFIQILNFVKHQNPHIKETASTIPAPDEPGISPVQNVPLTDSPLLIPDSPIPHPESLPNGNSTRAKKISLDELSVDHNAEWLARKRTEGRYIQHDEHFVLEQFKQYCHSKGKKYADYRDAYRNAFEWEKCQPKPGGTNEKPTFKSAGQKLAARYRQDAEREEQSGTGRDFEPGLRPAEGLRQITGGT